MAKMLSDTYIFAVVNAMLCMGIGFLCVCRLNAMNGRVLVRVQCEYAFYATGATVSIFKPFWGEWPDYGSLVMAACVLCALLCSARAWKGDIPPVSATDFGDLENLRHQTTRA